MSYCKPLLMFWCFLSKPKQAQVTDLMGQAAGIVFIDRYQLMDIS